MADVIRLSLQMGGRPLAIPLMDGSQVNLAGDVDVFPRDTGLEVAIPSEVDRRHFQDVVTEKGWGAITLTLTLENGTLVYRTGAGTWLPAGRYTLRLSIAGLRDAPVVTITVEDGAGEVAQTITFAEDSRKITLTAEVKAWDPDIKRLVSSPSSVVDGRQTADWIADAQQAPQRRACVLNLLAKLRTVPSVDKPIIRSIDAILGAQLERMYVRVAPDLVASSMFSNGDLFKSEGRPTAPIHDLLPRWIKTRQRPPEPSVIKFDLTSFRQAVTRNSMQVVFAVAEPGSTPGGSKPGCYADIDIDLGGSLTDVVGFAIHMGELLGSGITDHLDLHDRLAKDRDSFAKNFLYYDVVPL